MKELTLEASQRDILGKKARFLRREGVTPTHLFGHNVESLSLQCDQAALEQIIAQAGATRIINLEIKGEKKPKRVFVREIQRDGVTDELLHVDFHQVKMTEKMKVDVPIVLVGDAPAMKSKGRTLMQPLSSLSIECLPDKIPPAIEVSLSPLEELEQSIYVSDIALTPGITLLTSPEQLVVKVSEVFVEKEEAELAEAEKEPTQGTEEKPQE